ncbi:MAG: TIGR01212 family radical SAM protein [Peptoniphilus sp.]|nr:TIGR01212 family radical SAM protein [Peptoniphilus sp.]MDY3118019.1 TIGR01212 family radical SAM protein [Peptoniphilus sp.]
MRKTWKTKEFNITESLPYRSFSAYAKETFGKKVYKVPIHLFGSCPNRDGTKGVGGCIFCGEEGGSFEWIQGSIREQFQENKARMKARYKADGFIAYFQNFTGTYLPLEDFKKNLMAVAGEDIVGISISTRPDCVDSAYLDAAKEIFPDKIVTFELGLQSVNEETLRRINRGHGVDEFIDAAKRIKEKGLRLCTHMILDLPWDSREDIVRGAKLLGTVGVDEVKIHNLYVAKHTKLADMYRSGEFEPLPMEEFMERVILFLEHCPPEIVVGRLLGRAPEEDVLFANWNRSWYYIRDEIVRQMVTNNRLQGRLYRK